MVPSKRSLALSFLVCLMLVSCCCLGGAGESSTLKTNSHDQGRQAERGGDRGQGREENLLAGGDLGDAAHQDEGDSGGRFYCVLLRLFMSILLHYTKYGFTSMCEYHVVYP